MEMESGHNKAHQYVFDIPEQINDAATRASESISDIETDFVNRTRNTAQDIKELNAEYFKNIDLNLVDLAKIPSLITMLGVVLTLIAKDDLSSAKKLLLLAGSFLADNVDGLAASLLNQESDAGALLDAGADKFKILMVGTEAWKQGVVPKPLLGAIGAIETSHIALTAAAKLQHKKASFRPPKTAKYAMFARNTAVGTFMISKLISDTNPESKLGKRLHTAALGITAISACLEVPVLKTYINRTRPNGVADTDTTKQSHFDT